MLDTFLRDVRHALRMFVQSPAFALAAVAALTLGIAVNTAIFSVVNAVLLRPLPFPDPDRMVFFMTVSPNGSGPAASPAKFQHFREQTQVVDRVSAFNQGVVNYTDGSQPEQFRSGRVSAEFFSLFGAQTIQGRTFTPEEDRPGGDRVVVFSKACGRRASRAIRRSSARRCRSAAFPYTVSACWATSTSRTSARSRRRCGCRFSSIPTPPTRATTSGARPFEGRRLGGAGEGPAEHVERRLQGQVHERPRPEQSFGVEQVGEMLVRNVRQSLFVLIGAVGFVLLIACANVANLLLVRATGRKREIAIRAALGGSRGRIISQVMTESVVLSVIGGALGLAFGTLGHSRAAGGEHGRSAAHWRGRRAGRHRLASRRVHGRRVAGDGHPVRTDPGTAKLEDRSHLDVEGNRWPLRHRLPPEQDALHPGGRRSRARPDAAGRLGVVDSIGGRAVAGESRLRRQQRADDADVGDGAAVRLGAGGGSDGAQRHRSAAGAAGVVAASSTCCVPLQGGYGLPFVISGRPLTDGPFHGGGQWINVTPGYFDVFKIPVKRGRDFTDRDDSVAPPVVIINEAMANEFFKDKDPLNERLVIGKGVMREFATEGERQIIGVVGDTRDGGLQQRPGPAMYIPQSQVPDAANALNLGLSPMGWVVRTAGDPYSMSAAIQEELRQATGLPVSNVRSMAEIVVRSTSRQRFNMWLMTVFGASALLLAAIGIYGLMAYTVEQRTQEIGIRLSLGADGASVRRMVVFQGMRLAIVGVVIGLAASWALARLMTTFLFDVTGPRSAGLHRRAGAADDRGVPGGVVPGPARREGGSDGGAAIRVTYSA